MDMRWEENNEWMNVFDLSFLFFFERVTDIVTTGKEGPHNEIVLTSAQRNVEN